MNHLLLKTCCTITVIGNCVHAFNMIFYGLEDTLNPDNVSDIDINYLVSNVTEF